MKKHLVSTIILISYIVILIKVMVFKDIPTIKIGQLMLNFGGTDASHAPNFVPFKTILPYLLGYKGWIIAGINLIGNVALLVPVGFLVMFVYPNISLKKILILAVLSGLVIEVMQVILHVGIFDIDDVILNALGVIIGYWTFIILRKWLRKRKYIHIAIAIMVIIAFVAGALYSIYPHEPVMNPESNTSADLCGGTGGNGQIVSIDTDKFNIKRNDGVVQTVNLTNHAEINTSLGYRTLSDLKIGNRVTLVGGPNSDGSFTADAVFVCNVSL